MKAARGDRSAKWLSDRTAELGYRVSPTVIAKLDSGHRGNVLSVAELVVIAAADTAPIALLYPGPYDNIEQRQICSASTTEVIPGVVFGDYLASQWFSALLPWTETQLNRANYRRVGGHTRGMCVRCGKLETLQNSMLG